MAPIDYFALLLAAFAVYGIYSLVCRLLMPRQGVAQGIFLDEKLLKENPAAALNDVSRTAEMIRSGKSGCLGTPVLLLEKEPDERTAAYLGRSSFPVYVKIKDKEESP